MKIKELIEKLEQKKIWFLLW